MKTKIHKLTVMPKTPVKMTLLVRPAVAWESMMISRAHRLIKTKISSKKVVKKIKI